MQGRGFTYNSIEARCFDRKPWDKAPCVTAVNALISVLAFLDVILATIKLGKKLTYCSKFSISAHLRMTSSSLQIMNPKNKWSLLDSILLKSATVFLENYAVPQKV